MIRGARRGMAVARRGASGVVMVEFLIAFGPLWLVFLAAVQLALIGGAELIVRHAAVAGVRAAVVVLDDDPRFYDHDARGSLAGVTRNSRVAAIRRAVEARTAAIAPDQRMLGAGAPRDTALSVGGAIGTRSLARREVARAQSAVSRTRVAFPIAPGAAALLERRVPPSATITLRVAHRFACLVPIVSPLLCRRLSSRDPWSLVLEAEATLPSQSAAYRYASEAPREASP